MVVLCLHVVFYGLNFFLKVDHLVKDLKDLFLVDFVILHCLANSELE